MIFSTSTFSPTHTSTQQSTTTTTSSPDPSTTTYLPPTSTQPSQTTRSNHLLSLSTTTETAQTTTRIMIHTTTHSQSENLTTSPTFVYTTTALSSTTKPVNNTLTYDGTTTTSISTTTFGAQNDTFVNATTTTYSPTTYLKATTSPLTTTSTIETTTIVPTTTENIVPVETTTIVPTTTENIAPVETTTIYGIQPITTTRKYVGPHETENPDFHAREATTTETLSKKPTQSLTTTHNVIPVVQTTTKSQKVNSLTTTRAAIPVVQTTKSHKFNSLTTTRAAISMLTTTTNNSQPNQSSTRLYKNLRHSKSAESIGPQIGIILLCILVVSLVAIYFYKKWRNKKPKRESTVLPTKDEPLDPIIENILEEQDLKNQLRINSWRMAKLHKYLKKKHPQKTMLVESMEANATLMEKINIQIKNSPVLIYKKRGKKKNDVPTLKADLFVENQDVPTMKVDLMTVLKEPDKIKHISSVAKLKIKMLPVEYEHRRKRKNFKPLKDSLLPVQPRRPRRKAPTPPKSELEVLKDKKLVSNSIFKN
mgnify:CR=1 FL=1